MKISIFWKWCLWELLSPKGTKSLLGFKLLKDKTTELPRRDAAGTKRNPCQLAQRATIQILHMLPVCHRSRKKLVTTQALFRQPLLNCSASKIDRCCLEENTFKVSLVNSAPMHVPVSDVYLCQSLCLRPYVDGVTGKVLPMCWDLQHPCNCGHGNPSVISISRRWRQVEVDPQSKLVY